ncbi:3-ketoacyl-ACP reductase [Bacteroidia bacterium]|nr:3-ketoacyl-ACP reductase [Bacteroidia bacterium]
MKKIVLITGVSKNIGKSICKKYTDNGYQVIGTYKDFLDDSVELQKFKTEFSNVILHKVDLCNQSDVTKFIDEMKQYKFDAIVNNAGMLNMMPDKSVRNEFYHFDLQAFINVTSCNFISVARICLELKQCINENGNIVIISSGAGSNGAFASISYNATKAALINLTQSLSNSFYSFKKIRVNSVSPGWISGEGGAMNTNDDNPMMQNVAKVTPMGRNGITTEVADVVFYLTSEQASFITGANIAVDGGYSQFDVIYYEEATGKSLLK